MAFPERIAGAEVTLPVVEHDMSLVRSLCDTAVVLNFGRKIYDSPTAEVQRDPQVLEADLGSRHAGGTHMQLDVEDREVTYGCTRGVRGVSLSVAEGESGTVPGSNSSRRPRGGKITFDGRDLTSASPAARWALGMALVPEINDGGLSILLFEQNTLMALEVAQRGVVLELGREMLSGSAEELATDPSLAEAHLGAA